MTVNTQRTTTKRGGCHCAQLREANPGRDPGPNSRCSEQEGTAGALGTRYLRLFCCQPSPRARNASTATSSECDGVPAVSIRTEPGHSSVLSAIARATSTVASEGSSPRCWRSEMRVSAIAFCTMHWSSTSSLPVSFASDAGALWHRLGVPRRVEHNRLPMLQERACADEHRFVGRVGHLVRVERCGAGRSRLGELLSDDVGPQHPHVERRAETPSERRFTSTGKAADEDELHLGPLEEPVGERVVRAGLGFAPR